MWAKIKAATERGLLGGRAKVATMKLNPNAAANDTRLICVYTYDVDDERDCSNVREMLRDLGVTWKIPYKTDADPLRTCTPSEPVTLRRGFFRGFPRPAPEMRSRDGSARDEVLIVAIHARIRHRFRWKRAWLSTSSLEESASG
jgi:hypothetical protein